MRTETVETFELVKVEPKLLREEKRERESPLSVPSFVCFRFSSGLDEKGKKEEIPLRTAYSQDSRIFNSLRLRAKTAWFWLHAITAILTVRFRSGTYSFFLSMDTRGESETYKKTEQTRTIRQIYKDLTYHNSAELDSFSIM
ncbi:hypothetical protein TNCV_2372441 [Trichonephila clavipes]|nr:hypothetical protein TNCV_2372441 [Trichonephila clavipes]